MSNTFTVDRPTETTVKKIAAALEIMAATARKDMSNDWESLAEFANTGLFGEAYGIGDQFIDTWKDTAANQEYTYPYQLNHIGNVQLSDGETLENRPFLQAHYAHPFGVQFSHQRAFLRCPSGLAVGTYYFTIESAWGSNVGAGDIVCFTTTVAVPNGGRVAGCYGAPDQAKSNWRIYTYSADGKTVLETITPVFTASGTSLGTMKASARNGDLNSCQEMAYGWNRWKTSALRQYLNSDAAVGNWWTAQDEWDIAPDQLTTKAGFLSGCPADFVNAIKEVKVVTYPNTVYDDTGGNTPDITYDKVFIPSLEEIYVAPEKSGEGEYHEYWKRRSGLTTTMAKWGTYPQIITYAVENHTSPQYVRLRSANRGSANYTWSVHSSGHVSSNGYAYSAARFSPLVVL
jgi:hypothetical protein